MKKRRLGNTGLEVSEISFGAWQLGNKDSWSEMDDQTAYELVVEALARGVNLFDTAPNYGAGRSEILLGEVLSGQRASVVLVSKFGHHPDGRQDYTVSAFWQSLEASLKRLQTDYLDVLLLHNPPAQFYQGYDPIWTELEQARAQGMIRHYGASLDFSSEIEACLNNTDSEVLEIFFNVLHQDVRRAFPSVRIKKAGLIAKVPLDSGWLSGRYHAQSRFDGVRQRWSEEQIKQRAALVSSLDWLCRSGCSLTHKSLAYLLAYPEVSCVIPGMQSRNQMLDNLAAAQCSFTDQERVKLETFWDEFTDNGNELLPW